MGSLENLIHRGKPPELIGPQDTAVGLPRFIIGEIQEAVEHIHNESRAGKTLPFADSLLHGFDRPAAWWSGRNRIIKVQFFLQIDFKKSLCCLTHNRFALTSQ